MHPIVQRKAVLPLIEMIRGEPISRCLAELRKTQWYSRDQLRELQWTKLKALLHHCYDNISYYRERFTELQLHPEDIKEAADFRQLPLLAKDDIRFNQQTIVEGRAGRKVEHLHSGGTLGIPLNLTRDMLSSAYIRACEARAFEWHGIERGDRQLRMWGLALDKASARKERIKDFLLNRRRIPPFEISNETVCRHFDFIKAFKPHYIYGQPSAVSMTCRIMDELGLVGRELNIPFVVCSGETLYDYQRSRIEETLNCRVINEYGCSEMGPIALECPEGNMHITMENILVEFIEDESRPGITELVLTNLNSYTMPFLRYKIGDTGSLSQTKCPCGRESELMSFGAGRVLSMLVAADGRYVSGALFCYIAFDIIQKHGGIRDFRVVQKERGKLEISLVKDANYSEEILGLFTGRIHEKFGSETKIDYIFKDEIPLERSGKRLFVCSELPESHAG